MSVDADRIVKDAFIDLLNSCPRCVDEESRRKITRAFIFAKISHKGQYRKVGGNIPYITHPIAVAKIVGHEIGFGTTSVIAALLHDVVEDCNVALEEIEELFGEKVAIIVDGLTKIKKNSKENTRVSEQAETFRKMLCTIPQDMRVICIKIADRLHNMRTMDGMPDIKQLNKASENLFIYVPLASQLGLIEIRKELEDLSFKYSFQNEYNKLKEIIEKSSDKRNKIYESFAPPLVELLKKDYPDVKILPVTKSLYSTWERMEKKNMSFEEVHNYFVMRIIFSPNSETSERRQCFTIFSELTDKYNVRSGSIQDWIKIPKSNGFEALVCDVMGPHNEWIEVQVMTKRMSEVADKGFSDFGTNEDSQREKWIRSMAEEFTKIDINDIEDFEKFDVGKSLIYVFTPKGNIVKLPKESTVLDFAFYIHTDLGFRCIGGKVNKKPVSLYHLLNSTDQVEIIDSPHQTPDPKWLDYVITNKAKNSIKSYFSKERKIKADKGKEIFEKLVEDNKFQITPEMMTKLLAELQCKSEDDLFFKISTHESLQQAVVSLLKPNLGNFFEWVVRILPFFKKNELDKSTFKPEVDFNPNVPIVIDDTFDYQFAECCTPVRGEIALAYYSPDCNLIIHSQSCPVAVKLNANYSHLTTKVHWRPVKNFATLTTVKITGNDRVRLLLDVTRVISEQLNVNMRSVNIQSDDGLFEGYLDLYIYDYSHLNELISNLKKIKGIHEVERITKSVQYQDS